MRSQAFPRWRNIRHLKRKYLVSCMAKSIAQLMREYFCYLTLRSFIVINLAIVAITPTIFNAIMLSSTSERGGGATGHTDQAHRVATGLTNPPGWPDPSDLVVWRFHLPSNQHLDVQEILPNRSVSLGADYVRHDRARSTPHQLPQIKLRPLPSAIKHRGQPAASAVAGSGAAAVATVSAVLGRIRARPAPDRGRIKHIRVWGERNSCTTVITDVLKRNFQLDSCSGAPP